MSPYEIEKIQDRLFPALKKLGWHRYRNTVYHERDGDRSWEEEGWRLAGSFIIRDEDMSEGLAEELIRLAGLVSE